MPKKAKHRHGNTLQKQGKPKAATKLHHEDGECAQHQDEDHKALPGPQHYVKGLSNYANCCFFNSLMQMLASSAFLASACVQQELQNLTEVGPSLISAVNGINDPGTDARPFTVRPLLRHLAKKYKCMDGSTQQDSHEALMLLLDLIDEEFKAKAKENGTGEGEAKQEKNLLQQLLEACFISTLTCGTCFETSDSQQTCWVMTLPIQSAVLEHLGSESDQFRISKEKPLGRGAHAAKEGAKDRERSARVSAKAQKAKLKAEKRAEKRQRKGKQGSTHADADADGEGSDEEGEDAAEGCVKSKGDGAASAAITDLAQGTMGSVELHRERSRSLLQSMDLKQSMRERHGWSAPWLPGLWRMPDGKDFDLQPAQASLLMSLQMYFEKEHGVMWKCPAALKTIEWSKRRRRQRLSLCVRIADRAQRERVHEVPGRSHSTSRAIPGADSWVAFSSGVQTWEKFWTCPYDADGTKVVIQVAVVSEKGWYENQHPSTVADYNDPTHSSRFSQTCDRFEVTLNSDLGEQYVETHQLAIPPVRYATDAQVRTLASASLRQQTLSSEDYASCEKVVEDAIKKAQLLLECVHDALSEVGVEGVGKLFGAPLSLIPDEEEAWAYKVCGNVCAPSVDLSINTADVRMRFMTSGAPGTETWLYPAPSSSIQLDDNGHESLFHHSESPPSISNGALSAAVAAESNQAVVGPAHKVSDAQVSERQVPSQTAGPQTEGMRRVESWTQDKFTARPGRTHFPPLSDRNHMLAAVADSADEETADSSDGPDPDTPESHCPTLFTPRSDGEGGGGESAVAEGARHSKKTQAENKQSSKVPAAKQSSEPADQGLSILPIQVDVLAGSLDISDADLTPVNETRLDSEADLAHSLSELKLQVPEEASGSVLKDGECSLRPTKPCRLRTASTGILLYPDDGTRASERHVTLEELPPVLLCHFSRFQHSMLGTRKVSSYVSFPFHLYAHPNVVRSHNSSARDTSTAIRYRLKAVLEHHGRQASSGHYTSYVWRPTAVARAAARWLAKQTKLASAPITIPRSMSAKQRGSPDCQMNIAEGLCASRGSDQSRFTSRSRGASQALSEASEFQSASQGPGSYVCDGGRSSSSLTERNDSSLGRAQGKKLPGGRSPGTPGSLHHEGTLKDDDVADWEELADVPGGMSSCNTVPGTRPSADGGTRNDSDLVSARASLDDDTDSVQQGDLCSAELEPDLPSIQTLMAEDDEDDEGVWMKCDDERVHEVPWETVSSAQAYMLMYEQT